MRLLYLEQNDSAGLYEVGFNTAWNIEKYTNIELEYFDINHAYFNQARSIVFSQLVERVCELKIDVIFMALDHRVIFSIEHLQRLRQLCALVCYLGDDEHYAPLFYNSYCQYYDAIFCSNYFPVIKYRAMGLNSTFLPSSFDVSCEEDSGSRYEFDISFVGAVTGKGDRQRYLAALRKRGFNVKVFGKDSLAGPVSRAEMYKVFKKSKINLNFTGVAKGKLQDRDFQSQTLFKQIKGRCQEISLCGGFVLSEYAFGIEKLFEPGVDFSIFEGIDELVAKCDFYLSNDEIREKIAARGHQRAEREYSAKNVWKMFETEICSLSVSDSRELESNCIDRAFWQYLNAQVMARVIRFTLSLKFIAAVIEASQIRILDGFDLLLSARVLKRELKLLRRKPTLESEKS